MPRVRICFSKTGLACFIAHTDLPMLFARAARRAGLRPELTQGFSPHPRLALAPPLPVGVVGLREPADFWFEAWSDDSLPLWQAMMPKYQYHFEIKGLKGEALEPHQFEIRGLKGEASEPHQFEIRGPKGEASEPHQFAEIRGLKGEASEPHQFEIESGGVRLLAAEALADSPTAQTPSLTKLCTAASYRIESTAGLDPRELARALDAPGSPMRESGGLLGISADGEAVSLAVRDLERNAPSGMVRILREAALVREWSELLVTRTAVGRWNETERRVERLV